MWADLGALKMTGVEQLITLWEFYQGREHYNYNKESITIIKPLENKRGKESSGHCCYLSLCNRQAIPDQQAGAHNVIH